MRTESVLFLAVFVLIALLIAAARWILREIERSERQRAQEADLVPGEPAARPEAVPGEQPAGGERQPERKPARVTRRRVLAHPSTPEEFRRGIVLMTILGPCRGLEPWERSEAAQLGQTVAKDDRSRSKQ